MIRRAHASDLSPKARAKAEALAGQRPCRQFESGDSAFLCGRCGVRASAHGAVSVKRRATKRLPSDAEESLAVQLKCEGYKFEREVVFAAPRKWRFDFVVATLARGGRGALTQLAVEVEGGVYSGGRHTRGSGFVEDCRKYSEALCLGWRVLRVPSQWVHDGTAMRYIKRLL